MLHRSWASGKLILFGEYAILYGAPAVGISLQESTHVQWESHPQDNLLIHGVLPQDLAGVKRIIYAAAKMSNESRLIKGQWSIRSNVPRSGGFGSSSALCAAVARLALGKNSADYDASVHRLANHLESFFHGTPSGVDTGLALSSGITAWQPKKDDLPCPSSMQAPSLKLLFGALNRSRKALKSIQRIQQKHMQDCPQIVRNIQKLGSISREFINVAQSHTTDAPGFLQCTGKLMEQSQHCLYELGLSTNAFETLLKKSKECGVLAGKISGAGAGGAFILQISGKDSSSNICKKITEDLPRHKIHLSEKLKVLNIP